MTYPRSHLVDPNGGYYHVCSRCVRRAYLCGTDSTTGNNFDHRQQWLEDRILELTEIFAIDLCGYTVLSNHYHIVLKVDPGRINDWSDEEVVDKWMQLCPCKQSHPNAVALASMRKAAMLEDAARLVILRERLGSLSWLMRFINEPLARRANKEDGCKGRFWEGRFQSQRLLDEKAILGCMVYVDLNPVRAGMTDKVTEGKHTSLAKRTRENSQDALMKPINKGSGVLPFNFSLADYTDLAEWTMMAQQSTRPVNLPARVAFSMIDDHWLGLYLPKPGHWQRAIGSVQSLKAYANEIGQCWIRTRSQHLQA